MIGVFFIRNFQVLSIRLCKINGLGFVLFFEEVFFQEKKFVVPSQECCLLIRKEPCQTLLSNSSPILPRNTVLLIKCYFLCVTNDYYIH